MYWLLPEISDNGVADLQHWLVLGFQRSDLNQLQELLHWFEHTVREHSAAITKMTLQMTTFSASMTVTVFAANPILKQLYEHAATHDGSHAASEMRNQLVVLPASVDPTVGQLLDYRCPQFCNPTFEVRYLAGVNSDCGPEDSDPPHFSCSAYVRHHAPVTSEFIPAILISDAIQGKMGHV